jgi:DNA-binding PadR family transcriptional regulator
MFGKGDLKYVILDLLRERPRHGYDIIRALEERFHGFYSPSPGTVYPTLQLLEDQGLVTSSQQDGKKVYVITDEGRQFLGDRADTIDGIRDRVGAWWDPAPRAELRDLMQEFAAFGRFMFEQGARAAWQDPAKIHRIRDVVARARHDIEAILSEPTPAPPPPPAEPGPETTIV